MSGDVLEPLNYVSKIHCFISICRSNLTSPDPRKIYVSPWIPQNDILGHPNVKAFVSHCGKNGQYEALYHAVPVVAVPIFGDQPYNAERMRVKGFAEVLDLRESTVDEMVSTIMQVSGVFWLTPTETRGG
jgi:UDP:flavonoid glycosyltransferase YjiC (YdhE family)